MRGKKKEDRGRERDGQSVAVVFFKDSQQLRARKLKKLSPLFQSVLGLFLLLSLCRKQHETVLSISEQLQRTERAGQRRPRDLLDGIGATDDGDKLDDGRVERRAQLRAQGDANLCAVGGGDGGDVSGDLLDLEEKGEGARDRERQSEKERERER